ncbi:bifunctional ADP-dependent NAD(P)H-hydrate dehydratase/NAD(P)H-hydrate epimerase [Rouxiella sp. Mn2063]|uniref:bifunctional ADP-dependent NAD(P)H-hydrate dehydratase/NAD(P)H-hydrate epimerase n=1 Tax=Rouxiella sp. Mn2063 TaxID=3395262 RepID=UPI003BBFF727
MANQSEKHNATSLPQSVYSADWVRQAERRAAQETGISLFVLMQRAAAAAFTHAQRTFPNAHHWLILCGHGNNGGDGYELARLAKQAGLNVTLLAVNQDKPLPEEAQRARDAWLESGGQVGESSSEWPPSVDLIIDALLGTGLSSAARAPYDQLIAAINRHAAPVVALDIPSGLAAETGVAAGRVVYANLTTCFLALKPGLLTGQARDYVGTLHYDSLGLESWLRHHPALLQRLDAQHINRWFAPRRPCSHKGEHGRLLLIGGDIGFAGAIRMAGEAALRAGAGLVRVLTHQKHAGPMLTACPELMVETLNDAALSAGIQWATAIVIGPGLGQGEWGKSAYQQVANSEKPALWDADALNMLAKSPQKRQNRVLTPHPGEAARLLGCSIQDIESDRLLSIKKLVERFGGTVVLKGAGTLIAAQNEIATKGAVAEQEWQLAIADVGNAGMASGGMGDVLSGIIGSLLAQKHSLYDAACAGTLVHGAAADSIALRQGTRGMLATDLITEILPWVNPGQKK